MWIVIVLYHSRRSRSSLDSSLDFVSSYKSRIKIRYISQILEKLHLDLHIDLDLDKDSSSLSLWTGGSECFPIDTAVSRPRNKAKIGSQEQRWVQSRLFFRRSRSKPSYLYSQKSTATLNTEQYLAFESRSNYT